jgi:hypothetical protein
MNAAKSDGVHLTPESLPDFIRANELVAVHFWAPWNAYDQCLKQILKNYIISQPEFSKVVFASFDTIPPDHHELCKQLQILNLPYLAIYREGIFIKGEIINNQMEPASVKQQLRRLLEF